MNRMSYTKLYKKQGRMVLGEIKSIVPEINPEDLQELAQHIWHKVWAKRSKYRRTAKAQTWVGAVARNTTKDWIKQQKRLKRECVLYEHDVPSDPLSDREPGPYYDTLGDGHAPSAESLCAAEDTGRLIEENVASMPKRMREVWELMYIQDMSAAECADQLGVAPSTVRTLVERIRTRLS